MARDPSSAYVSHASRQSSAARPRELLARGAVPAAPRKSTTLASQPPAARRLRRSHDKPAGALDPGPAARRRSLGHKGQDMLHASCISWAVGGRPSTAARGPMARPPALGPVCRGTADPLGRFGGTAAAVGSGGGAVLGARDLRADRRDGVRGRLTVVSAVGILHVFSAQDDERVQVLARDATRQARQSPSRACGPLLLPWKRPARRGWLSGGLPIRERELHRLSSRDGATSKKSKKLHEVAVFSSAVVAALAVPSLCAPWSER